MSNNVPLVGDDPLPLVLVLHVRIAQSPFRVPVAVQLPGRYRLTFRRRIGHGDLYHGPLIFLSARADLLHGAAGDSLGSDIVPHHRLRCEFVYLTTLMEVVPLAAGT